MATITPSWFAVDKKGLAKLLERRGRGFVVLELLQNAWDQNVQQVNVSVSPSVDGIVQVSVIDDDPEGFKNLSHAYTLFAESTKKGDPLKRGRFNLGEKLVLACCESAMITTTTGRVEFGPEGRRVNPRRRRLAGSEFYGRIKMTRAEQVDLLKALASTIPPDHVTTVVNGDVLPHRVPLATFRHELPTEIADEVGYLKRVPRTAVVHVYAAPVGVLYEMGIPVVETGDSFDVNVMQKVPLTMERDNVPLSYLAKLRVGVLNAMASHLTREESATTWVREAAGHKDAEPWAVGKVMTLRFGEKRVAYDPSDPEANRLAVAKGYTVVTGGALTAGEWHNVKASGVMLPAGRVTPSPRPFSEDGEPLKYVEQPTPMMHAFVRWAKKAAILILDREIIVGLANDPGWGFGGCYGGGRLTVNVAKYGGKHFCEDGLTDEVIALVIHEFAHHYAKGHLTSEFYDACCDVGARFARRGVMDLWEE